jgi:hypothetical protein
MLNNPAAILEHKSAVIASAGVAFPLPDYLGHGLPSRHGFRLGRGGVSPGLPSLGTTMYGGPTERFVSLHAITRTGSKAGVRISSLVA